MICGILDHGDDPGRFTIIHDSGLIITCNSTGKPVFERRCRNPHRLVHDLRRERGVGLLNPSKHRALLKKIDNFLQHNSK